VRRPVYSTGRWVADRARGLAVAVPTIVTPEEYAAAQAALESHRKRGLRQTRHVYLLEGGAVCSRCGADLGIASAALQRRAGGRLERVPARYVCTHRRRPPRGSERCGAPYHLTAAVDAALWSALVDVVTAPGLVERALRQIRDAGGVPDLEAQRAQARADLARLDRTERTLLERADRITPAALDAQLARLVAARADATGRLAEADRVTAAARVSLAATAGLEEEIAALRAALADPEAVPPAQRRELVRLAVGQVEIGDEALVAQVHLPAVGLALGPGSSASRPTNRLAVWIAPEPRRRAA
jgi:hypothetical protein